MKIYFKKDLTFVCRTLRKKFDCCFAMNSLLHVPKADLGKVLASIDSILNKDGLFYMGVYGGKNSEHEHTHSPGGIPRFFSFYSEAELLKPLRNVFEVLHFEQFSAENDLDFQSVIMRKKR